MCTFLLRLKIFRTNVFQHTTLSLSFFFSKVEKLQKKAYENHLKNLAKRGSSGASLVPDDIDFHCIKCKVFACKAKHIKTVHDTCRIVPDYEVNLHNVTFKDAPDSFKNMPGGLNKTGKTYCKNCGQDWGNRAKNEFGEFPLIKISSFRVKRGSGRSDVYKKWKDFPYALEAFESENDVASEQSDNDDDQSQ